MGEESNLDLYEKREHEVLERLGRMEQNDPERKSAVNELTALSSIRVSYEQTEQARLNNNARNDIDEERLKIEQAKLENDRERNKAMWIQALLSFLAGTALTMKSYHMDEKGYPYKDLKIQGMKLIDRVRGR